MHKSNETELDRYCRCLCPHWAEAWPPHPPGQKWRRRQRRPLAAGRGPFGPVEGGGSSVPPKARARNLIAHTHHSPPWSHTRSSPGAWPRVSRHPTPPPQAEGPPGDRATPAAGATRSHPWWKAPPPSRGGAPPACGQHEGGRHGGEKKTGGLNHEELWGGVASGRGGVGCLQNSELVYDETTRKH